MVLRWTQTKILFLCGQWADNIRWVGGGLSSPPLVLHWARGSTRSMPQVQVGWHHYSPMGLQKQRNNDEKKTKREPTHLQTQSGRQITKLPHGFAK
jgi:hypothetical protein